MTGGGFGGSAVALVPVGALDGVRRAVAEAFAEAGFGEPLLLRATPGAAARVESVS
jgi:galactokinase